MMLSPGRLPLPPRLVNLALHLRTRTPVLPSSFALSPGGDSPRLQITQGIRERHGHLAREYGGKETKDLVLDPVLILTPEGVLRVQPFEDMYMEKKS